MANFDWNNDDYQDDRNFDPLEPGVYRLQCVDAEEKTTRSGGTMIAATFEVVGSKRKVWHNFNIVNSNPTAERIGRSIVTLPLFHAMRDSDVDRVCDAIAAILLKARRAA